MTVGADELEGIRQAARALVPLLRRSRSTPVARPLRRAARYLDEALIGPQAAQEVLGRAVAELGAFLDVLQSAESDEERGLYQEVARVLVLLSRWRDTASTAAAQDSDSPDGPRLAVTLAATAKLPVLQLSSEMEADHGMRQASATGNRQPAPTGDGHRDNPAGHADAFQAKSARIVPSPGRNAVALSEHLERLTTAGRRRAVALDQFVTTWRELALIEGRIEREVRALRWMGSRLDDDRHRGNQPPGLVLDFAACFLGPVVSARVLGSPVGPDPVDVNAYVSIVRTCAGPDAAATLARIFDLPHARPWRAVLLGALLDCGQLETAELSQFLDDDDDQVAVEAARLLAWIGGPDQRDALATRARSAIAPTRAAEFAVAAVALGDDELLNEVRAWIASGSVEPRLLDALALAGGPSDAQVLVRAAELSGPIAAAAARAAGRLGNRQIIGQLLRLEGRLGPDIVRSAVEDILGSDSAIAEGAPDEPPRRLFRGEPWSVASVMKAATSPDERVSLRHDLALELVARTGVPIASPYSPFASARSQAETAALLGVTIERERQFPSGRWLRRGYLLRR